LIDLQDGRKLITLKDAATYITELPEDERQRQEWQKAARSLIGAAEHRDLIIQAHIDVLRAIPRNEASSPIPIGTISVGESGG
jgi:intergrase/recombinase